MPLLIHPVGVVTAEVIAEWKKALANAIVQKQSTNVNVKTGDSNMISNWKLAVDRALTKARK